jgi:hypothetical protein
MSDEERFEHMGCLIATDNDNYIIWWECMVFE